MHALRTTALQRGRRPRWLAHGLAPCLAALSMSLSAYPLDSYEVTDIGRLEEARRVQAGELSGVKQPSGALLTREQVAPRLLAYQELELPAPDPKFTAEITGLLGGYVDRYALADIKAMYWGLGTHMGNPVFQNKKSDLVSHVADQGDDYADRNIRLYSTAAAANPHNDPSDVVGLLCVRTAPVGGTSMIASAMSIYNRILEQHPEYLEVLARGFPHDLRGEGAKRAADEITPPIPVYSYYAGKLSCCLNSKSSTTAREQQGEPLTRFERDAIQCVENYVEDPELCLTMDFRPGDIQFLNNYVILHTRTAFQDGREPDQRRLLLRLWLNLCEGRPLAPGMGDRFNNGSRGGVPAMSAELMESNA